MATTRMDFVGKGPSARHELVYWWPPTRRYSRDDFKYQLYQQPSAGQGDDRDDMPRGNRQVVRAHASIRGETFINSAGGDTTDFCARNSGGSSTLQRRSQACAIGMSSYDAGTASFNLMP